MGLHISDPFQARSITVNFAGAVTMDPRDQLAVTNLPVTSFDPPACSSLNISSANSLDTLYCTNLGDTVSIVIDHALLTIVDTVGIALNAAEVRIPNSNLTQTSVDAILIALADGTGVNGVVDLSGGFNVAPSAASLAARTELAARGWTIITV